MEAKTNFMAPDTAEFADIVELPKWRHALGSSAASREDSLKLSMAAILWRYDHAFD